MNVVGSLEGLGSKMRSSLRQVRRRLLLGWLKWLLLQLAEGWRLGGALAWGQRDHDERMLLPRHHDANKKPVGPTCV